jgi:hypothetical protein
VDAPHPRRQIGQWLVRVIRTHGARSYWGTLYDTFGTLTVGLAGAGDIMDDHDAMDQSQEIGIRPTRGATQSCWTGIGLAGGKRRSIRPWVRERR